jgi:hypothetical protein
VRIIDSGSWVCSLMGKAMLSYTDISVNKAPLWNNMPYFALLYHDFHT